MQAELDAIDAQLRELCIEYGSRADHIRAVEEMGAPLRRPYQSKDHFDAFIYSDPRKRERVNVLVAQGREIDRLRARCAVLRAACPSEMPAVKIAQ
jgi:hypothetical protein